MAKAKFQRGSGCFVCQSCGKLTRDTGRGEITNGEARFCKTCVERMEDENSVADACMTQAAFDKKWRGANG